jgi:putative transposase
VSSKGEPITQAYRYALRVAPEQEARLLSFTGAGRFAFNWGLALVKERIDARKRGEDVPLPWSYHRLYTEWRNARDRVAPWRAEVPYTAFLTGLEGLGRALQGFSHSRKQGRRAGFPRFRARGRARERIFFMHAECRPADTRHVRVPKLGLVRSAERLTKLNRLLGSDPNARIVRATLSQARSGTWFVSFAVERSPKHRRPRRPDAVVGMDLGLRRLAVLSTGEHFENPRPVAGALHRLRRLQRSLDRQRRAANPGNYDERGMVKPGPRKWRRSKRMLRTQVRVARLHERISNLRMENAHQLTTYLTRGFGVIGVESLNVAGMLRDRHIARSVSDAGLGMILRQLRYKASWSDVTLVSADRFYPSSKTCSRCGEAKAKLPRSTTVSACEKCGLEMDRDHNAALNLAKLALEITQAEGRSTCLAHTGRERLNARGGQVRPVPSRDGRSPAKREGSPPGESSRLREGPALTTR